MNRAEYQSPLSSPSRPKDSSWTQDTARFWIAEGSERPLIFRTDARDMHRLYNRTTAEEEGAIIAGQTGAPLLLKKLFKMPKNVSPDLLRDPYHPAGCCCSLLPSSRVRSEFMFRSTFGSLCRRIDMRRPRNEFKSPADDDGASMGS